MTRDTKVALGIVGGLLLAGCAVASVLVVLLFTASDGLLGGSPQWSADAVPERELPRVFGVKLPVKPLTYQTRSLGFQDGLWDAVIQLPPGSAPSFVSANRLEVMDGGSLDDDVREVIDANAPGTPALEVRTLTLPAALLPDGGAINLHRSGFLLEGPGGETWVHLSAFET